MVLRDVSLVGITQFPMAEKDNSDIKIGNFTRGDLYVLTMGEPVDRFVCSPERDGVAFEWVCQVRILDMMMYPESPTYKDARRHPKLNIQSPFIVLEKPANYTQIEYKIMQSFLQSEDCPKIGYVSVCFKTDLGYSLESWQRLENKLTLWRMICVNL